MRSIVCTILLVISFISTHAQSFSRSKGTITVTHGQQGEQPLGRNVSLEYDDFFKSYKVTYTTVEGVQKKLLFKHIVSDEGLPHVTCEGRTYSVNNMLGKIPGELCPDLITFSSYEKSQPSITYTLDFCDPNKYFKKSKKK